MRARCVVPLFTLLSTACADEVAPRPVDSAASAPASAAEPTAPPTVAMPLASIRTTSPVIELGNLDGQVKEAEKRFEEKGSVETRARLVSTLLLRFSVKARLDDFARATDLAKLELGKSPSAEELLLVAQGLAASHRFTDALAALDRAKALEPQPLDAKVTTQTIEGRRFAVLVGLGRYEEARAIAETLARSNPNAATFADHAVVLAAMGAREHAEALFLQAENKYRGVSPFFVAQLYFDRGSMFEKVGDLTNATALYRAAHKRLPQHVHVATHLAPLVPPSEAIAMLEPLVDTTDDADVHAQLGVIKNLGSPGSGDANIAKAKERYDAAMEKYPDAFADHAGWFWLNVGGDPKKALDAAKRNLENRKTPDAYELVLAAADELKDAATLCPAREAAKALTWKTPRLESRLGTLTVDCPATAKR